jgi:hypothetical protein
MTHGRREALQVVRKIGIAIVKEKKAAVLAVADGQKIGKSEFQNDLLSLLIKSNLASDLPDSMRMTDEEIFGRKCRFALCRTAH